MITRTGNRMRVSNRNDEQQKCVTPRKYGNIISNDQKNGSLSNRKGNQVLLYSYQNENIEESYIRMKRMDMVLDGSCLGNSNMNNQNEIEKGKNSRRNRDFVSKVENINKMHDQISCLLRYVKGQDRSKESFVGESLNRSTMMEKGSHRKEKSIVGVGNKKIEESLMVGCVQEQSSELNEEMKKRFENLEKFYLNQKINNDSKIVLKRQNREILQNVSNLMEGKLKKGDGEMNLKVKNVRNQKLLQKIENQQFLQVPIVNKKEKENVGVTQRHNEDNLEKLCAQKLKINYEINYEKEIQKVRERILDSEKIRREMQQKYLHSDRVVFDRQNQKGDIKRLNDERQKVNKNLQKLYQNTIGSNIREIENLSYGQKDLNLSVHACKSRIEFVQKLQVKQFEKQDVNRFVAQRLAEQVKLDKKLRDSKYSFGEWKQINKWKLIQQRLQQLGYAYTQKQLMQQLQICPNESDPFMSEDFAIDVLEETARNFVESQNYWGRCVCGCISKQKLEESGFDIKQNDLNKRGYLQIQDLVCFVNMNTQNFFRNRDFISIYKRFLSLGKNKTGIDFTSFKRALSFCV